MRSRQSVMSKMSPSRRYSRCSYVAGRLPFHKKGERVKPLNEADERRAQHLITLYTEFKRRYLGQSYRIRLTKPLYVRYFRTAAVKLRHLKARGYPATPEQFVWALFTFFGKGVYPVHFASDTAWAMFFKWKSSQASATKSSVSYKEELDTLNHLCEIRGESVEVVWPQVRASGMFSDEFVRKFGRQK
jgi:hypothetical protein